MFSAQTVVVQCIKNLDVKLIPGERTDRSNRNESRFLQFLGTEMTRITVFYHLAYSRVSSML